MKRYIPFIIITALLLLNQSTLTRAQGQSGSNDKYSILTEPFNLRPINMHRGQLQVNTGYRISVRNKSFDNDGGTIGLAEDGTASIQHKYIFNVKYGILEFAEVGVDMNYFNQGIRGETRNYISGTDFITINELNQYNGFEDLQLHLSVGLPFDVNHLDFAIRGALSLPTAKHEPDQPEHTFEYFGSQSYLFNYRYNNRNGTGVPFLTGSAHLQLSFNKLTLVSDIYLSQPVKEGKSIYWNEFFENNRFIYSSTEYSYLNAGSLNIYGALHLQAIGWLDTFLAFEYLANSGGWIEQYGNKYARPDQTLSYLQVGLEIQLTPLLRLNELAGFAIAGQNSDAPFYIMTALSFNMLPF